MNTFARTPSQQTEQNNLIGKTAAGYQAWFHASEDPDHGWGHWSNNGTAPETGNVHPEMFPDFSEYPDSAMFKGRFENYPDGREVRFYQAHDPNVIDVHFRWMKEYGIDGVGVQRFYGATSWEARPEPTHLTAIRAAAEKYDRIFYIMYDTSGCGRDGMTAIDRFKADLLHNVEEKGLIESPMYAHAEGKPVICIWGLAETEKGRYPEPAYELITWLKERGYFVIGGLPDNNYASIETDYAKVYASLDMASPWTPGRFRLETLEKWISRHLAIDLEYCKKHNMYYQPVMYSGFAWSNFEGGGNPNAAPRHAGKLLWEQAKIYAKAGIRNAYFAMFDEYDEATALAKAAQDSFDIPKCSQYFQTLSADGTWLSSDYYLRLAGEVTKMLRGEREIVEEIPIEHSNGPVYFRNGFEMRPASVTLSGRMHMDMQMYPVDICASAGMVLDQEAVQLETASVISGRRGDVSYTGSCGFGFSGIAMTDALCYVHYRIAKTKIKVKKDLELSYMIRPVSKTGMYVGVDLLFDDGSRLGEMLPEVGAQKGSLGKWSKITHDCSMAEGKVIEAVAVIYHAVGEARFAAYIDDIVIEEKQN